MQDLWREPLDRWPEYLRVEREFDKTSPVAVFGLGAAQKAHLMAALKKGGQALAVFATYQQALRAAEDIRQFSGEEALCLPPREFTLHQAAASSQDAAHARIAALYALYSGGTRVLVAPLDALQAALMPAAELFRLVRTLKVGDDMPPAELAGLMLRAGYERVESVDGCGQFALRGGIFDIFTPGMDTGCRIEFFDTEVDSIRSFDVLSQRSIQTLDQVTLLPAREVLLDEELRSRAAERISRSARAQAARLRRSHTAPAEPSAPEQALPAHQPEPETEVYLAPEPKLSATPSVMGMSFDDGWFDDALPGFQLSERQPPAVWTDEQEGEETAKSVWEDETKDAGAVFSKTPDAAPARPLDAAAQLETRFFTLVDGLKTGSVFYAPESCLPLFLEQPATALDYFAPRTGRCVFLDEPARLSERAENIRLEFTERFKTHLAQGDALPEQIGLILPYAPLLQKLTRGSCAVFQTMARALKDIRPRAILQSAARAMPSLQGKADLLSDEISSLLKRQYGVVLMAGGQARAQRLNRTLMDHDVVAPIPQAPRPPKPGEVLILPGSLSGGFEYPDLKFAVIAEEEIFGAQRQKTSRRAQRKDARKIDAFTDLNPGDYIVHENHGIGVYIGVVRLSVEGKQRDYLHLKFAGTDKLYVPTDQMDRVQKYIGGESAPKINKLGSAEWARQKNKARRAIADMAEDLVRLYAHRSAAEGYSFSPDTPWQQDFESAFPYEETPDQLASIEEIKRDMEKPRPMERLLCGDVGYGKTEVALRAAFKAVADSRQVAILVPTTVLAAQHYHTLMTRFSAFPVTCEMLSRFRTPAEQRAILRRISDGGVDIVVGTHRLLAKDVKFKNLGLLVIDEEQRFGVAHKERIKQLRENIDVLTMTATPIPRTLHMSMVGIRDMSLIENPPEERYPVQTSVLEYNDGVVREAIVREIGRGGQVYFVYNRVRSIDRFAGYLQQLVPEARICVGHGQMAEGRLEQVMLDFMEHRYDVLLCSTIIESGLDIPLSNTIVIYDADHFGLAQLYQMRGRVGRSNRLAYAYFTYRKNKVLSETAEKRLRAIMEFTEFGSGFKIAMRDLEIRGAGNILGAEQHGHMSAVGYEMYVKMMDEAIRALRGEVLKEAVETTIDLRVDAYLPESYIRDPQLRMLSYKRISSIQSDEDRDDVLEEMIDRYGEPPDEALMLLTIAIVKAYGQRLHVQSLAHKTGVMTAKFYPAAPVDPMRLLEVLSGYRGAITLTASDPPSLTYRRKGAGAEEMLPEMAKVLRQICKRTDEPEKARA